jgi:hypothetical protein
MQAERQQREESAGRLCDIHDGIAAVVAPGAVSHPYSAAKSCGCADAANVPGSLLGASVARGPLAESAELIYREYRRGLPS